MDTRTQVIKLADDLIRHRGYNAFSFSDIAKHLQIKNASVHYHFPTKTTLGVAVIQEHRRRLQTLKQHSAKKSTRDKLEAFLNIYATAQAENNICLVGSLATDIHTVETEIKDELKNLAEEILNWVMEILRQGKKEGIFQFAMNERTKALLIITNMLGSVQLTRVTGDKDFKMIKKAVINDLIQMK